MKHITRYLSLLVFHKSGKCKADVGPWAGIKPYKAGTYHHILVKRKVFVNFKFYSTIKNIKFLKYVGHMQCVFTARQEKHKTLILKWFKSNCGEFDNLYYSFDCLILFFCDLAKSYAHMITAISFK